MKFQTMMLALLAGLSAMAQQTFYVTPMGSGNHDGTSWDNATSDLGAIVQAARPGDAVWVAAGTYHGGFTMKENVAVYGGFSGSETRLDERCMPGSGENLTILCGDDQYRVVQQEYDFATPTAWDGFVITRGNAEHGSGALLRQGGILRRCILTDNHAGLPAVGDYLAMQGGVVFHVAPETRMVWIIAPADHGRLYPMGMQGSIICTDLEDAVADTDGEGNTAELSASRPVQQLASYTGSGKTDWYLPAAGEWAWLIATDDDGKSSTTKAFELTEKTLASRSMTPLTGKCYWSSTAGMQNDLPGIWQANFASGELQDINIWQYNHVRGVRTYEATGGSGQGGAVYANAGSRVEGCLLYNNDAAAGSEVYARGNVSISGCTIVTTATGLPLDGNAAVSVVNTIVASHVTGTDLRGNATYSYSAVQTPQGTFGTGCIALADMAAAGFKDAGGDNYQLADSSPLLTTGQATAVPQELDTDLCGQVLPGGTTISMGAYLGHLPSSIAQPQQDDLPTKILHSGEHIILSNGQQAAIYDLKGRLTARSSANHLMVPTAAGTYLLRLSAAGQRTQIFKLTIIP